jgi:hypothetical protein
MCFGKFRSHEPEFAVTRSTPPNIVKNIKLQGHGTQGKQIGMRANVRWRVIWIGKLVLLIGPLHAIE